MTDLIPKLTWEDRTESIGVWQAFTPTRDLYGTIEPVSYQNAEIFYVKLTAERDKAWAFDDIGGAKELLEQKWSDATTVTRIALEVRKPRSGPTYWDPLEERKLLRTKPKAHHLSITFANGDTTVLPVAEDGLTWTYQLCEHDGSPVDADHARY